MLYINSHINIRDDENFLDYVEMMRWEKSKALGTLHLFWFWCAEHREDGNLTGLSNPALARTVELGAEQANQWVNAMLRTHWIENTPYFRVSRWWDRIGRYLETKYKTSDPLKWKRIRQQYLSTTLQELITGEERKENNTQHPTGGEMQEGGIVLNPKSATEIHDYLCSGEAGFKADLIFDARTPWEFAYSFYKLMHDRNWTDAKGRPVKFWKEYCKHAFKTWADGRNQFKITEKRDKNAPETLKDIILRSS